MLEKIINKTKGLVTGAVLLGSMALSGCSEAPKPVKPQETEVYKSLEKKLAENTVAISDLRKDYTELQEQYAELQGKYNESTSQTDDSQVESYETSEINESRTDLKFEDETISGLRKELDKIRIANGEIAQRARDYVRKHGSLKEGYDQILGVKVDVITDEGKNFYGIYSNGSDVRIQKTDKRGTVCKLRDTFADGLLGFAMNHFNEDYLVPYMKISHEDRDKDFETTFDFTSSVGADNIILRGWEKGRQAQYEAPDDIQCPESDQEWVRALKFDIKLNREYGDVLKELNESVLQK